MGPGHPIKVCIFCSATYQLWEPREGLTHFPCWFPCLHDGVNHHNCFTGMFCLLHGSHSLNMHIQAPIPNCQKGKVKLTLLDSDLLTPGFIPSHSQFIHFSFPRYPSTYLFIHSAICLAFLWPSPYIRVARLGGGDVKMTKTQPLPSSPS